SLDVFIDRAIQMFQERPINAPLRDDPWRVSPYVRANSPRLDETDLNVEWRELIRDRFRPSLDRPFRSAVGRNRRLPGVGGFAGYDDDAPVPLCAKRRQQSPRQRQNAKKIDLHDAANQCVVLIFERAAGPNSRIMDN